MQQLLLPFYPFTYPNGEPIIEQSVRVPRYTEGTWVRVVDAEYDWQEVNGLEGYIEKAEVGVHGYTVVLEVGTYHAPWNGEWVTETRRVYLTDRELVRLGRWQ